jgi:hypothetical protein
LREGVDCTDERGRRLRLIVDAGELCQAGERLHNGLLIADAGPEVERFLEGRRRATVIAPVACQPRQARQRDGRAERMAQGACQRERLLSAAARQTGVAQAVGNHAEASRSR